MRFAWVMLLGVAAAGCGSEIGDECIVSSDCSPNGDRQCDSSSKGGYCTIQGCDVGTCPEEATCVRFFTGSFSNRPCDPQTENLTTDDCSFDETCSIANTAATNSAGNCVPRSSEIRFCMRTCESESDCRDGYECRDFQRMREHGGESVLAPGQIVTEETAVKFCAPSLD